MSRAQWRGFSLLLIALAFLVLCLWAAWSAPGWSPQAQAAAKFLFADFRPEHWWYGTLLLPGIGWGVVHQKVGRQLGIETMQRSVQIHPKIGISHRKYHNFTAWLAPCRSMMDRVPRRTPPLASLESMIARPQWSLRNSEAFF